MELYRLHRHFSEIHMKKYRIYIKDIHLKTYSQHVGHLRSLLASPVIGTSLMSTDAARPLLCASGVSAQNVVQYRQQFAAHVVGEYDYVVQNAGQRFEPGFWMGYQGKVNAEICFEHASRTRLGIVMKPPANSPLTTPGEVDKRLYRGNQFKFLSTFVIDPAKEKNWQNTVMQLQLFSPFGSHFNHSMYNVFSNIYSWAFDYQTPEGQHLHEWDFITKSMWCGPEGYNLAVSAIKHEFERHRGIVMDQESRSIDARFFASPREKWPEKHCAFPKSFGCDEWGQLMDQIKLGAAYSGGGDLNLEMLRSFGKVSKKLLQYLLTEGLVAKDNGRVLVNIPSRDNFRLCRVVKADFEAVSNDAYETMVILYKHGCIDANGIIISGYDLKRDALIADPAIGSADKADQFLAVLLKNAKVPGLSFEDETRLHHMLDNSRTTALRGNSVRMLKAVWPWMFDLTTAETLHLHENDLICSGVWETGASENRAKELIAHVFERHLGLKMIPPVPGRPEYYIDERLLSGNVDQFLISCGVNSWTKFNERYLLFVRQIALELNTVPKGIPRLLRWIYPWAFDQTTPEGKHLHPHDIGRFSWDIADSEPLCFIKWILTGLRSQIWQVM